MASTRVSSPTSPDDLSVQIPPGPITSLDQTPPRMTSEHNGHVTTPDENNPFLANGELSRKADFIIQHSRISRTEIHIADPDSPQAVQPEEAVNSVPLQQQSTAKTPTSKGGVKSDGGLEVEVGRGSGDKHKQTAEQVKLSSNKKKMCCTIQ